MGELEAAVETTRRFDKENLALVFERPLQVLEVRSHVTLGNADNGRQITSGDGPVEQGPVDTPTYGMLPLHP